MTTNVRNERLFGGKGGSELARKGELCSRALEGKTPFSLRE